jgi:hypothetical protein
MFSCEYLSLKLKITTYDLKLQIINTKSDAVFTINNSYHPEIINMLNRKQFNSKQEKETVKYLKLTYVGKATKFVTKLLK